MLQTAPDSKLSRGANVRKILVWIATGLGGLLVLMAQTPMSEATSNIATYLPQWLIDAFPSLQSIAADNWATVLGGIVAVVGVGALTFRNVGKRRELSAPRSATALPAPAQPEPNNPALSALPVLSIDFSPRSPWVRRLENSTKFSHAENALVNTPSLWFRVKVTNTQIDKTAYACRNKLTRIEYSADSIAFDDVDFALPRILGWSEMEHSQGIAPMDLIPGGFHFVDIVSTDPVDNKLIIVWDSNPSWEANVGVTDRIGCYRLTITTAPADGRPTVKQVIVHWNGQWDQTRMEMEAS